MELAQEAPQASASLLAVEQQASASMIEWAQLVSASLMEWAQRAFASLMDSSVLDSFWQRVIPNLETNFCRQSSIEDLIASQSPQGLMASSKRWAMSRGGMLLLGPWCFDCRGAGGMDILRGEVVQITIIWGAHLGGCIHQLGEIFQFGG